MNRELAERLKIGKLDWMRACQFAELAKTCPASLTKSLFIRVCGATNQPYLPTARQTRSQSELASLPTFLPKGRKTAGKLPCRRLSPPVVWGRRW